MVLKNTTLFNCHYLCKIINGINKKTPEIILRVFIDFILL